jgi:hypothetical protein
LLRLAGGLCRVHCGDSLHLICSRFRFAICAMPLEVHGERHGEQSLSC